MLNGFENIEKEENAVVFAMISVYILGENELYNGAYRKYNLYAPFLSRILFG